MAHEIETMAYAGETPWHGLGNNIDANSTVEQMAKAAGLNWTVSLRKIFTETKKGEKISIPLKRALVRDSDNKVLTVCGDFWKPLQNTDMMEFFREYTENGGARLETAGSLHGGKLVWALASINKGFTVKGSGGRDKVKGHILLASHHQVGRSNSARTTATRVVCANTFAMAMNDEAQYSQSHTRKFDMVAAKDAIGLAIDQIAKMGDDANKLAALKLSEYDAMKALAGWFQPKPEGEKEKAFVTGLLNDANKRSKVLDSVLASYNDGPGAQPGTGWGVFNGVTHFIDHVAGRDQDARLFNAWFGQRAEIKRTAMSDLLEMAN